MMASSAVGGDAAVELCRRFCPDWRWKWFPPSWERKPEPMIELKYATSEIMNNLNRCLNASNRILHSIAVGVHAKVRVEQEVWKRIKVGDEDAALSLPGAMELGGEANE